MHLLFIRERLDSFLRVILINKTVVPFGHSKARTGYVKACGCVSFINDFQDVDYCKMLEAKTLSLPIKVNCFRS